MKRPAALWVVLALAGLALTAGITAAASRLSSQHVGLSSEPLSAGDRLAPADVRPSRGAAGARSRHTQTHPSSTTSPSRSSPATAPRAPTSSDDGVAGSDNSGKEGTVSSDSDDD